MEYERTELDIPPRSISATEFEELFGDWASSKILNEGDGRVERKAVKEGSQVLSRFYILKPKDDK